MEIYEEPLLDVYNYSTDDLSLSSNTDIDDGGIRLPGIGFGN